VKKIIYFFIAISSLKFDILAKSNNSLWYSWNSDFPVEQETTKPSFIDSISWFFGTLLYILIVLISILLIVYIIHIFIRFIFEIWYSSKNLVYLKVILPRADSKLDKEKETKKDFKEKIWIMSMFFKAIHKVSEAWLKDTFLNFLFWHAKISLEMAYIKWEVYFFIVTYKTFTNLIRQHLSSIYNDVEIREIDPKKEYVNLKEFWYQLRAASLWKEHDDVFPIKTFKYLEDDPLNNFTNVFWWLNKEDSAIWQIVIKPKSSSYNKKWIKAAWLVAKWKYKKNRNWLLKLILKPFSFFYNPLMILLEGSESVTKYQNNAPWASEWDAYKIFNQAETESQKIMWESVSQPAFKTSMRILVSSKKKKDTENWVHAIVAASSMFTDEYNNSLDNPQVIEDALSFIITPLRYFAFKFKLVWFFQNISYFSSDEISTLYHLPDVNYNKSPIIAWLDYKKLAPPHNLKIPKENTIIEKNYKIWTKEIINPETNKKEIEDIYETKEEKAMLWGFPVYKDAILLWWNEYRNKKTPIYFSRKDRSRHHYILWKSGWGKSVFVWYLARQDLRNWDWLCVIDPHGDLVEDVLAFAPKKRVQDIIVFDPSDDERPMWLNILELISDDPEIRKREMDRAAMDSTEIFIKIFWDEIFGPRIQHYFRNWCLTLMEDTEDPWTLIDVPRLFVDENFMKYKISKITNPIVKSFWKHEYSSTWDREKQEMIPYFSAKFWPFITNTTIRNIIWQPKSAFNLREIMDNRKALLVNLSKWKIWALNAQLLWLIFVSKVNMAAMSRADINESERKDFYMYVDEFQNFATETFWEILSEARKYHLSLIMAHQFIAQIWWTTKQKWDKPSIRDAVFGNVWTIQSFKVGADDAEYLSKEYAPILSEQNIIGIANYTAYIKLNIDNSSSRVFDLKTIWDETSKNEKIKNGMKISNLIKEYSRKKYGRKKRYVDMEIEARLWIT